MNIKVIKKFLGLFCFIGAVLLIIGGVQEARTIHQNINITLLCGAISLAFVRFSYRIQI